MPPPLRHGPPSPGLPAGKVLLIGWCDSISSICGLTSAAALSGPTVVALSQSLGQGPAWQPVAENRWMGESHIDGTGHCCRSTL